MFMRLIWGIKYLSASSCTLSAVSHSFSYSLSSLRVFCPAAWHFSRINLTFTQFLAHQSRISRLNLFSPLLKIHQQSGMECCCLRLLWHDKVRILAFTSLASYCLWTGSCWCSDCLSLHPTNCLNCNLQHGKFHFSSFERDNNSADCLSAVIYLPLPKCCTCHQLPTTSYQLAASCCSL